MRRPNDAGREARMKWHVELPRMEIYVYVSIWYNVVCESDALLSGIRR